ncbi:MAG: hypothetical protein JETT_3506 [Candidatus Jettenia ecosi]|uniref:Uncharacterized protein n=1 Tax=Candidatus Jettenia ecosi TaxID=2494326 RepID=A0A533Q6K3_9BACT|nr:MAG: hypothetical protein JETT_3506 [Candidatus Jettenia ecosi]
MLAIYKIENKVKVKSGIQIEGSGYKPEPAGSGCGHPQTLGIKS